jgi:hypothetical protein
MALIRIYQDGTFESLSAVDVKAQLADLRADLKIIIQVEKLRAARTDAKRMANTAKDKELLGKIKALKAKLTSNRNSSQDVINAKIGKLKDVVNAPKVTRGNKTGDPRRNPTRMKSSPVARYEATMQGIQDKRLQKAFEHASNDLKSTTPRTVEFKERSTKLKKIKEMMAQSKEGTEFSKTELAAVAPPASKPSTKKSIPAPKGAEPGFKKHALNPGTNYTKEDKVALKKYAALGSPKSIVAAANKLKGGKDIRNAGHAAAGYLNEADLKAASTLYKDFRARMDRSFSRTDTAKRDEDQEKARTKLLASMNKIGVFKDAKLKDGHTAENFALGLENGRGSTLHAEKVQRVKKQGREYDPFDARNEHA